MTAHCSLGSRVVALASAIALCALLVVLLLKNVNLASPIMGSDEYIYFVQAREFPNLARYLAYDPAGATTSNMLYFAIGHLVWSYSADPSLSMRVLQSFIYLLNLPIFYILCRRFLGIFESGAVTAVGLVSALSSYSAYFMPETLYFTIFMASVCWSVWNFQRPYLHATVLGAAVAALLLTKPHAASVFLGFAAAYVLCVIAPGCLGVPRSTSTRSLAVFAASTYGGLVTLSSFLTRQLQLDPLFFVGALYSRLIAGELQGTVPFFNFAAATLGNGTAFALLCGFPSFIAFRSVLYRFPTPHSEVDPPRTRTAAFYWLFILCLLISAFTIGMTVVFSAVVFEGTEIFRIHGRYYSFILPLYLLLMFAASSRSELNGRGARIAAALGIGLVAFVYVYWRKLYTLVPHDFPEIFALTAWVWSVEAIRVSDGLLLVGAAAFVAILFRPEQEKVFFCLFLAALGFASLVQTTRWQFAHARSFQPYTELASAVRGLIAPESRDRGLVVGEDRGNLSYVLFALRSRSRVLMLPAGTTIDQLLAGDAEWLMVQGRFNLRFDGHAATKLQNDKLVFLNLRPRPPFP